MEWMQWNGWNEWLQWQITKRQQCYRWFESWRSGGRLFVGWRWGSKCSQWIEKVMKIRMIVRLVWACLIDEGIRHHWNLCSMPYIIRMTQSKPQSLMHFVKSDTAVLFISIQSHRSIIDNQSIKFGSTDQSLTNCDNQLNLSDGLRRSWLEFSPHAALLWLAPFSITWQELPDFRTTFQR